MTKSEMSEWIQDLKLMNVKPTEQDAKFFGLVIEGHLKDMIDPDARELYAEFLSGASGVGGGGNLQLQAAARDLEKHIAKVKERLTDDIRAEDWVTGVKVVGNKIEITLAEFHQSTPEALGQMFEQRLAELGHPGVGVVAKVQGGGSSLPDAADALKAHVKEVKARFTEEIRAEDWVKDVKVMGNKLELVLEPHHQGTPESMASFFRGQLAKLGFPGVDVVAKVDGGASLPEAADALKAHVKKVKSRLTEEIRAEDWVKDVKVVGNKLELVLEPHHQGTPGSLAAFFKDQVAKLGFAGVDVVARVDSSSNYVQAAARALEADVKKVKSRMTEDIRAEDYVSSVRASGDGVEITLQALHLGTVASMTEHFNERLVTLGYIGVDSTVVVEG
jgi:hypothetical protein